LKIVVLVLATICTGLFLCGLISGRRYESYIENLDSDSYPMKEYYIVGLFLNGTRLFRLRGKLEQDLKTQSKLVWDNIYYEYYTVLTWAQFLTVALFTCCVGFILCGFVTGTSMVITAGIMVLAIMAEWNLVMSKMKETVQARKDACEMEFPNMVSKLSLLINSGMILREAWELVAYGKEGELYDLMRTSCDYMRNGDSDSVAIHKFGMLSDSAEIKKFSSLMIQGLEKGNRELVDFLVGQASEYLAHKRQLALQQGEKAAGKLIIPLGITFVGIILIIIAAAMQGLSF